MRVFKISNTKPINSLTIYVNEVGWFTALLILWILQNPFWAPFSAMQATQLVFGRWIQKHAGALFFVSYVSQPLLVSDLFNLRMQWCNSHIADHRWDVRVFVRGTETVVSRLHISPVDYKVASTSVLQCLVSREAVIPELAQIKFARPCVHSPRFHVALNQAWQDDRWFQGGTHELDKVGNRIMNAAPPCLFKES
jgi:hypothetical protein